MDSINTVKYSVERVSNISPDVNRLALSLSQDLIHSVSRGHIKTPKHIVLLMTVKSLTGNVELITLFSTDLDTVYHTPK